MTRVEYIPQNTGAESTLILGVLEEVYKIPNGTAPAKKFEQVQNRLSKKVESEGGQVIKVSSQVISKRRFKRKAAKLQKRKNRAA